MQRCWQLLAAVAAEALDMPASQHGARKAALLRGARQYLERGHAAYMQTIIQSHRSEARPPAVVHALAKTRLVSWFRLMSIADETLVNHQVQGIASFEQVSTVC